MNDEVPRFANFVNGSFVVAPALPPRTTNNHHADDDANTATTTDILIPLYDPSTNDLLSHVPNSSHKAVREAVSSAKAAYATWRTTPVQVRGRLLAEYAHLLRQAHVREEIA
jgi:malonate-semialdehyde dehydrogenase (acetylating)/methylmalonate-semialdehyde dehydrogenase